mmetsp:Transcript_2297/g.5224  ORF Transcript_2297/g.5224 Transcript_2297/m.5224 type:complete len:337 (-) Transcript_2297:1170-2180(-)
MCSKVKDRIGVEDLLQVGVVCSKSVMGTCRLREEKTHGISLVSERGLHSDEDISKLLSVNNEVLSIRVEVPRCRSPVLLQVLGVGSELVVFIGTHTVGDVKLRRADSGLRIIQHRLHDSLLIIGSISNIVSLLLQLLENSFDGVKDVKVSSGSDVTLVRGERENGDGNLLLLVLLGAQVGPLHRTVGKQVDTVGERNTTSSGTFTSSVNDGLNGTVNLGQGDLECNLDRMQTKLGCLPLLEGLEHKWHSAHVRHIQLLQDRCGLLVILGGRSSNKSESSKVDDRIDDGLSVGAVEVILYRSRKVKPSRVDGHNASTTALQLRDQGDVVGVILGVDV